MHLAIVKSELPFEYEVAHLFTEPSRVPLLNGRWRLHINQRWLPRCHHLSITEKRMMSLASKDNKRKYADGTEHEALLKKQKTINDDDDGESSMSTDDFLLESEEEQMNLPAGSEGKLLIQQARSDDRDTSDSEKNGSIRNNGDTSDDEEE
jgi:hypothetical protein